MDLGVVTEPAAYPGIQRLSPFLRRRRSITDGHGNIFENSPELHWASVVADCRSPGDAIGARRSCSVRPRRLTYEGQAAANAAAGALLLSGCAQSEHKDGMRASSVPVHHRRAASSSAQQGGAPGGDDESWWGSIWEVVPNGAQKASKASVVAAQKVTEASRVLASEVKSLREDSGRDLACMLADIGQATEEMHGKASVGLQKVLLPQQSSPSCSSTFCIEWHVEVHRGDPGEVRRLGLTLQPSSQGSRSLFVAGIAPGFALEAWNATALSVTVRLQPNNREAVIRRIIVRPGDEIIGADDVPIATNDNDFDRQDALHRIRRCTSLTFRRQIRQRQSEQPTKAAVGGG